MHPSRRTFLAGRTVSVYRARAMHDLPHLPKSEADVEWVPNGVEFSPRGWESNDADDSVPTIFVYKNDTDSGVSSWCVSIDPRAIPGSNEDVLYLHAEGHAPDIETAKSFAHRVATTFLSLLDSCEPARPRTGS